jgi:hypothetical protein
MGVSTMQKVIEAYRVLNPNMPSDQLNIISCNALAKDVDERVIELKFSERETFRLSKESIKKFLAP